MQSVEMSLAEKLAHAGNCVTHRCDSLWTESIDKGLSHGHSVSAGKIRDIGAMEICSDFYPHYYFA